MMQPIPQIPDSAPFTPAQRAWLNGFLAGMFSQSMNAEPQTRAISRNVAVLYATQTAQVNGWQRRLQES